MYAIRALPDEEAMFASTLFVRMRTNRPCLRVRNWFVCRRIARLFVYATRANADEKPVFACTLFVQIRANSP